MNDNPALMRIRRANLRYYRWVIFWQMVARFFGIE